MAQHVRQGAMLLYRVHYLRAAVEEFLLEGCGVRRAEAVGDYRRRVDGFDELEFVVEADDFGALVSGMERSGGRTPLLSATPTAASYALSSGLVLRVHTASRENWWLALVRCADSKAHLCKLAAVRGSLAAVTSKGPFPTDEELYAQFGLSFIEPELREGYDEVKQAAHGNLPVPITRGVSVEGLGKQIRFIDKLNERLNGIRILKSAEVDILADGSLEYPEALLRELDYTVCSVHSRFALGKSQLTECVLRPMDNRYFNTLGQQRSAFCSGVPDLNSTSSALSRTLERVAAFSRSIRARTASTFRRRMRPSLMSAMERARVPFPAMKVANA